MAPRPASRQTDGLIVEAAPVVAGDGGLAGMQGIRQVLEGEGFRPGRQRSVLVGTIVVLFWFRSGGRLSRYGSSVLRSASVISPGLRGAQAGSPGW